MGVTVILCMRRDCFYHCHVMMPTFWQQRQQFELVEVSRLYHIQPGNEAKLGQA